jgi:hypothetical protein
MLISEIDRGRTGDSRGLPEWCSEQRKKAAVVYGGHLAQTDMKRHVLR